MCDSKKGLFESTRSTFFFGGGVPHLPKLIPAVMGLAVIAHMVFRLFDINVFGTYCIILLRCNRFLLCTSTGEDSFSFSW